MVPEVLDDATSKKRRCVYKGMRLDVDTVLSERSESTEVPKMMEGADHGLKQRRSVIAALAAAGIAGPIMFAVVALAQSLLRPEHSLVADPISELAAGPSG